MPDGEVKEYPLVCYIAMLSAGNVRMSLTHSLCSASTEMLSDVKMLSVAIS